MSLRTQDFLQRPPMAEKQMTKDDYDFTSQEILRGGLKKIYDELCMLNPSVLCESRVEGGNVITDTEPHLVRFIAGGKPVTVYKVILWTQSGKEVNATFAGMAGANDGFTVPATMQELHIPISEMSIALSSAGTLGVNIPSNLSADYSVFIYGFTTPQYMTEKDYG